MEEKKYAFYTLGRKQKSVIDLIESGLFEQLRIGEITQKQGKDISYHGSPIYEIVTNIKDIETEEVYLHRSHNLDNVVDFLCFSELENKLEWSMKIANEKIDKHVEEIKKLQEIKSYINTAQQELVQKMSEIQPESMLMKME